MKSLSQRREGGDILLTFKIEVAETVERVLAQAPIFDYESLPDDLDDNTYAGWYARKVWLNEGGVDQLKKRLLSAAIARDDFGLPGESQEDVSFPEKPLDYRDPLKAPRNNLHYD